jgi:lysozyme family protein
MDERFNKFIEILLKHEGGYVWDPDDSGGETKYGITKTRYPELDIKHLNIQKAKDIYFSDYYVALNLHYIKDDNLALHLFDMAVNAGRSNAVKLLQEVLKGVSVDGMLGPITGAAATNAMATVNLVDVYKAKRVEYYYKVAQRGNNIKFLKGWVNRIYSTEL